MTEYYRSNGGRFGLLWKREDYTDYFFSCKTFEWIKCRGVMILPSFYECTEDDAKQEITLMKEKGPYNGEVLPVRFFLSETDHVFAKNVIGEEFRVVKGGEDLILIPLNNWHIDPMWGGINETHIDSFLSDYKGTDEKAIPYKRWWIDTNKQTEKTVKEEKHHAFVMISSFETYTGWQMKVMDVCQKFYEQYDCYPNFIRMKETTLNELFDECDREYENPDSEEHAVCDSKGNVLIPIQIDGIEPVDDNDTFYDEDDDTVYPIEFGPQADMTLSFITNKYELKFLEGEELPDGYFVVQLGEGPDDGGEDAAEQKNDDCKLILKRVA